MRIKTQYIISIIIFGIILAIISASVVLTNEQVTRVGSEEQKANDINTDASNLAYISNAYFLTKQSTQVSLWQNQYSLVSSEISGLGSNSLEQQAQINHVNSDLQNLGSIFNNSVSYVESIQNQTGVVHPILQLDTNNLNVQNQALAFDASILSKSFDNQANQLRDTNNALIFVLLGSFGAYFIAVYFVFYRRTLRSITNLQDGTKIIGSGNLDYSISSNSNDEVGELSQAFNQMTANLKTVTASKTDLEQEIVGRKQAEASLRESEQRWATTLSSIGDAVIATDVAGSITFMNGVAEKLTGWTMREGLGKSLKEVFHLINEETRIEVESPVTKVLEKGMIVGLANHTILVRKDGSEVPLDDSGAPIRDEKGNVAGVVLVFHDIVERKIMEEKLEEYQKNLEDLVETRTLSLKESEEKYRTLFDSIDEGFCIIDMVFDSEYRPLDYRFLEVNASFERQTGMHDAKGRLMRSFAPNHEAYWFEIYGKVALTGQPVRFTNEAKALSRYYDVYAFPVGEGKIRKVGILFNDISVRMNLEKQLKNSERLATIGATAGMVGHDIRNPLQAITSDVFLARSELASFPESEEKKNTIESLDEIEKNIDYINKIVQDLQDYARPLNPQAEESDIKQVIEKLLAKNRAPDNVKVTVKIEEATEKICADSYYINRIMYNLVTNAVQAMPNGGKLTIQVYKDSNDLVIAVKDTGVGIPKEIQGKMFTPMFTTKSKGQGFGLPVVKRMTEALGGTVSFESQEGKGTTFKVRLPPKD